MLSATGGGTTYFAAHSADGLVQRTSDGVSTVNKVWDDQNLLQERVGALVTNVQYTDYPGYWGGLSSQSRGGASGFFGFDSQGSARILVSVGGIVTDSYSFKAFGEELAAGSGTANPYRYVGMYGYYRDTANRYYVRARHLSVPDGRWISRDPIGYKGRDWNLYRYVTNSPITEIDPSGLCGLFEFPCTALIKHTGEFSIFVGTDVLPPKWSLKSHGKYSPKPLADPLGCDSKKFGCRFDCGITIHTHTQISETRQGVKGYTINSVICAEKNGCEKNGFQINWAGVFKDAVAAIPGIGPIATIFGNWTNDKGKCARNEKPINPPFALPPYNKKTWQISVDEMWEFKKYCCSCAPTDGHNINPRDRDFLPIVGLL